MSWTARAYLIVLVATAIAVAVLASWRIATLHRSPRRTRSQALNEWVWTLIPVAVLAGLLWAVAK